MRKIVFALFLIFSGCVDQELARELSDRQSREIIVTLARHGILAKREGESSRRGDAFRVSVNEENYLRSLEILQEYGLPRQVDENILDTTKPRGFVPNTREMNAFRLDHALSLEVERMLVSMEEIVDAKVVVRSNLTRRSKRGDKETPASASAVIKYAENITASPRLKSGIIETILRIVPGLTADRVRISTTKIQRTIPVGTYGVTGVSGEGVLPLIKLAPFLPYVPEEDRNKAAAQLLLFILLFSFCGAMVGFYFGLGAGRSQAKSESSGRKSGDPYPRAVGTEAKAGRLFIEATLDRDDRRASGNQGSGNEL